MLTPDLGLGQYTPLWAWGGTGQLAGGGASGLAASWAPRLQAGLICQVIDTLGKAIQLPQGMRDTLSLKTGQTTVCMSLGELDGEILEVEMLLSLGELLLRGGGRWAVEERSCQSCYHLWNAYHMLSEVLLGTGLRLIDSTPITTLVGRSYPDSLFVVKETEVRSLHWNEPLCRKSHSWVGTFLLQNLGPLLCSQVNGSLVGSPYLFACLN